MEVAVIGTGYVGLVVGACLAETGNHVICVDIHEERVEMLKKGEIPFYEVGLHELVVRNCKANRLKFTTSTREAVQKSLVVFLAVPTPQDDDGSASLEYILEAAKEVASGIDGYKIIVDKSTVPVGTSNQVREVIGEITKHPFDVVSNPEFLKEGAAVEDFLKPDRVVIGCDSPQAEAVIRDLYAPFVRQGHPIISMRVQSAEMTKYAANTFLATKVSLINEIARLCELVGADIREVRMGIGTDKRIGSSFLFPGMGFGGSCFPKDLRALKHTGDANGLELLIVQAVIKANEIQKRFMLGKILRRFGNELQNLFFGIWGLAFKANTDDVRESPVFPAIDALLESGAKVKVYDPEAMDTTRKIYGDKLIYAADSYDAVKGVDALLIGTEWNEFRQPDFDQMKGIMKQPIIFDGRNLFTLSKMKQRGFEYYGVGQAE